MFAPSGGIVNGHGIVARDFDLDAATSEQELLALIDRLNDDPEIDGILVQLPLPHHISEASVTNRIRSDKDVDGFHAFNVGKLALRQPGLRPCTPTRRHGTVALLRHCEPLDARRGGRRIEYRRPADGTGIAAHRFNGDGQSPLYTQPGRACTQC